MSDVCVVKLGCTILWDTWAFTALGAQTKAEIHYRHEWHILSRLGYVVVRMVFKEELPEA